MSRRWLVHPGADGVRPVTGSVFKKGCFEPIRDCQGAVVALETGPLPHGRGSERDFLDAFLKVNRSWITGWKPVPHMLCHESTPCPKTPGMLCRESFLDTFDRGHTCLTKCSRRPGWPISSEVGESNPAAIRLPHG